MIYDRNKSEWLRTRSIILIHDNHSQANLYQQNISMTGNRKKMLKSHSQKRTSYKNVQIGNPDWEAVEIVMWLRSGRIH